jgi:hypothetical protein
MKLEEFFLLGYELKGNRSTAGFLPGLLLKPEDRGDTFLQTIGSFEME